MTEQETKEYEPRADQIAGFVKQLEMMYPRRMSNQGGHHGQEAEEITWHG
jgi:hypothetical protein